VNAEELESAIVRIGIPDRTVAVNGWAENAWCVARDEDGMWEVYWRERGNKIELERFASENQACSYMLGRLTYSQILAGLSWTDVPQS
jgi:hypothetical protein